MNMTVPDDGHLDAISMTLTALISALPEATAAAALSQLQAAIDVQRENQDADSPASFVQSRDEALEGYLELLRLAAGR